MNPAIRLSEEEGGRSGWCGLFIRRYEQVSLIIIHQLRYSFCSLALIFISRNLPDSGNRSQAKQENGSGFSQF